MDENRSVRKHAFNKQDFSWKRVRKHSVYSVKVNSFLCSVLVLLVLGQCASAKQISETLQRALSAVRGPSPGAKKLLNIPEDGGKCLVS